MGNPRAFLMSFPPFHTILPPRHTPLNKGKQKPLPLALLVAPQQLGSSGAGEEQLAETGWDGGGTLSPPPQGWRLDFGDGSP